MDIGGALTRKIGPLPAWAWGGVVGGAALGVKMLRGGGGGGVERETVVVPTGAPSIPHDWASQMGRAMDEIRQRLTNMENDSTPPPGSPVTPPKPSPTSPPISATPSAMDLGTYVAGLRALSPALAASYKGPKATAGESRSQREARLRAELQHFGHKAATDLGVYVAGLRKMFPALAATYKGPRQKPGESKAQRDARLRAERAHFGK